MLYCSLKANQIIKYEVLKSPMRIFQSNFEHEFLSKGFDCHKKWKAPLKKISTFCKSHNSKFRILKFCVKA